MEDNFEVNASRGIAMWIVAAACALFFLLGAVWLVQGNDFFLAKVFAPREEALRRETFEQSKAYNQGMVQELQNMQFEYIKAAPEQKAALASIILHRAADYDVNLMPADLRTFIEQLRRERVGQ
jgi:hypothetical protein